MTSIKDRMEPKGKWEFDQDVSDCFENMLERSIPQYDVMREAVFNLGKLFVITDSYIVDVGCSKGNAIDPYIGCFEDLVNYRLIDPSKPMFDYCVEKYKESKYNIEISNCNILENILPNNTSLALSILTIQFTPIEYRLEILEKIYNSLIDGGALIFVEKVLGSNNSINQRMVDVYHDMKKINGYSDEDIERKRLSLEGILVPVTANWNEDILRATGFKKIDCFWRWMNFAGWVAVK